MILKMVEQPEKYNSPKTAQIRQKIKEVFGWDCAMNDDMLLKQYTVTDDGDLIIKLK
jgi:phosphoribosylpyrophosphate synthetase